LNASAIQSMEKLSHCTSEFLNIRCISSNDCCSFRSQFTLYDGSGCFFLLTSRHFWKSTPQTSENFYDRVCYHSQSGASTNCQSWKLLFEVACLHKDSV